MLFFQGIIKVPLAVLIRSYILGGLLVITLGLGYTAKKKETPRDRSIAKVEVDQELLQLNALAGQWLYNGTPFNGYATKYHYNGQLVEKTGFLNGKREGPALKWHEDGTLASKKNYAENRLEGMAHTWWPNGQLSSESHYENRVRQGEQKRWYPNGQLARIMNFNHGKEEGLQQAWLQTGGFYVNYEAKNGRFFGMKRTNLCYQVKDGEIQQ